MLTDIAQEMSRFIDASRMYMTPWSMGIGGLWVFSILHWLIGSPLNVFGIQPRRIVGLFGIILSPFLHQNFNHLFFNTMPLFALGLMLLSHGAPIWFLKVSVFIATIGGLGVWLLARSARHIGASGLISGYFGLVVVMAYFLPGYTTIFLAVLVIYYFGSILLGIFPQAARVSWESHLYGFLAGCLCGYIDRAGSTFSWIFA